MTQPPTASDLLADAKVIEGMRRAYEQSAVGTDRPIEQGGFIVRDPSSGSLAVVRIPAYARDSLIYPICADGMYQGKQIVASFHTHPNTGPEWRQQPSAQDVRLSQEYPETMGAHQFVITGETIYHIDNDGVVYEIGHTRLLLGLDEGCSK
jgi:hypothetical protein